MPPIISIVGKSDCGKTTLIEKLIPELKSRGYRIGTIKHTSHGFDIDRKGKDSWRHRHAGADAVMVTSAETLSLVKSLTSQSLDDLLPYFTDMDLVITEGYKHADKPKIEVYRAECSHSPLDLQEESRIAMVTDAAVTVAAPVYGFDQVKALADLIEARFL
ncbi:MAG: molybdopterin-guanine dinucleotide biosynthesis protein B [Desulfobacterales bacterium]|jgi:molybdopterin-guanine dinucleotide biosynthesis adapter protein